MTLDFMDNSGNSTLMESSKVIKSKFTYRCLLHDFRFLRQVWQFHAHGEF